MDDAAFKTKADAFEKGWQLGNDYMFAKMLHVLRDSAKTYAKILQQMRNGELTTISDAIEALEPLLKHHQETSARLHELTTPMGDIVDEVARINPEIAKGLQRRPPWSG